MLLRQVYDIVPVDMLGAASIANSAKVNFHRSVWCRMTYLCFVRKPAFEAWLKPGRLRYEIPLPMRIGLPESFNSLVDET